MKYLLTILTILLFASSAQAGITLTGDYTEYQKQYAESLSPFFGNDFEIEVVDYPICGTNYSWGCTTFIKTDEKLEPIKIQMRKDTPKGITMGVMLDEIAHTAFKTIDEDRTDAFVYNFLMWFNWYLK